MRGRARNLLAEGWKARRSLWPGKDISLEDFLVQSPKTIATKLLLLTVDEVREIPNLDILHGRESNLETVGILNRSAKQIIVAQKFGFEQSRFTLAHELAHWMLHPQLVLHREKSINFMPSRSAIEQEADLFAAEFLMPSKLVREHFLARFEGMVDGRLKDGAQYYWLSQDNPQLNDVDFYAGDSTFRAIQFAKCRLSYGRRIISLCEFFRVSPRAMAIQLVDLGLVK